MAENPDIIATIGVQLGIVAQLHTARLEALLTAHGLTPAQFSVLNHLARRADTAQRISDIARAVEVHQPAVTKTVAKFENLGLVAISGDKRDQRSKCVTISPGGLACLRDIFATLKPGFQGCYDGWTPEDLAALQGYLRKLVGWYDANRL